MDFLLFQFDVDNANTLERSVSLLLAAMPQRTDWVLAYLQQTAHPFIVNEFLEAYAETDPVQFPHFLHLFKTTDTIEPKMARHYGGDIEGKFWFGIQTSDDARQFGVEPVDIRIYSECQVKTLHPMYTPCTCSLDCVVTDLNQITFTFSDPAPVQKKLAELDAELLEYTPRWAEVQTLLEADTAWKTTPHPSWVSYDADALICAICNNEPYLELAARYVLGVQILRCLITYGACNFWCEV
jgi:hypothetical protein